MKFVFALFFLVICFGCSQSPQTTKPPIKAPLANTTDSTVEFALQQLYARIQKNGHSTATMNERNNEILLNDTIIKLKAKVEFNGQKQGKWVYAANFKVEYNAGGQQELAVGAIGMGATSREAFEVCIKEWMANFGEPFVNMLRQENALIVDGFSVYSGFTGVRGSLPPNTWLQGDAEMTKKIVTQIHGLLQNNKHALIPVDIKVLLGSKGIEDGECRIDNFISFELLKELQKLKWPRVDNKVIFTQFYLVQK